MDRLKMKLTLFVVLATAVIIWQFPALSYRYAYRYCLLGRDDHYPDIVNLNNAPDRPTYDAQSDLICQAEQSHQRLKTAETTTGKIKWGQQALTAYSDLIEKYQFDSYRADRAAVYASLAQYDNSLADYNYLVINNPDNYWMVENRANLYLQMNQPAQALADFQLLYQNAQNDPTNSPAYLDRIVDRITTTQNQLE